MKSNKEKMTGKYRSVLASLALAGCASAFAESQVDYVCDNASFQGSFGFTLHGDLIGSGATSAVGVINADGDGGLHGTETAHIAGVVHSIDFPSGTYTINPDCTGTAVLLPVVDGVESHGTVSFVLTSPDTLRIITTTPGRVLEGGGERIDFSHKWPRGGFGHHYPL